MGSTCLLGKHLNPMMTDPEFACRGYILLSPVPHPFLLFSFASFLALFSTTYSNGVPEQYGA